MKITTLLVSFFAILSLFACSSNVQPQEEQTTDQLTNKQAVEIREILQKQINDAKEGDTITFKKDSYLVAYLDIKNKKNITLDFANSTVITNQDTNIFTIENSSDIRIKNLTTYHKIEGVIGCFSNCFNVNHCKNIHFENCDINGSGFIGVCINQSDVVIENSILHKCEMGILVWHNNEDVFDETIKLENSKVIIKNTKFENNKSINICIHNHYTQKATADISINGKSFVINEKNYKKNIKNGDIVESPLGLELKF